MYVFTEDTLRAKLREKIVEMPRKTIKEKIAKRVKEMDMM